MPLPPAGDTDPCDTANTKPETSPKNNPNHKSTLTPAPATAMGSAPPTIPIWITPRTKKQLESLKNGPDESYDTVISRLCERLTDDDLLNTETLKTIDQSLAELRKGIFSTHEEIMQDLIERTVHGKPEK